jgi:hypothetical protein
MKKEKSNISKGKNKIGTPKNAAQSIISTKPMTEVRQHIRHLIEFQHACNSYIIKLSGLFTDKCPDNLVCVSDIIAECYGIPDRADAVCEIINKYSPACDSAHSLAFAGELAEAEILKLHTEYVPEKSRFKINLTQKCFIDLLLNASNVNKVNKVIDQMSFFHSEPAFEISDSNKCNFNSDHITNFIFKMLYLENEGEGRTDESDMNENCYEFIYNTLDSIGLATSSEDRQKAAEEGSKNILRVIEVLRDTYKVLKG